MKIRHAAMMLVIAIGVWLTIDSIVVEFKEARISHLVVGCGGTMGSIPMWPLGTEYRIVLKKRLTLNQVRQLTLLNRMRGWVGVAFQDCDYSTKEIQKIRQILNRCHLFCIGSDDRLHPFENSQDDHAAAE